MSIRIGFTGDFCPWQRTEARFREGAWQDDFREVQAFFADNHLNVADLECPLTHEGQPIPKTGPHLRAMPETAAILKHLHIELVATANNHFMDYGAEGMRATWAALAEHGIAWMGSGENQEEASQVCYRRIEGQEVALINVAENEWSTTTGARSGVNPLDPVQVYRQIGAARRQAEHVLVVAHGGHEHYALPSPRMKALYRFFIEAGADAVIGHHPHIVSGYEAHQCKPIFYSLGNFCFDWLGPQPDSWYLGMLLKLDLDRGRAPRWTYRLVEQNRGRPGLKLLNAEEEQSHRQDLESRNALIADDQALEQAFDAYCADLRDVLLTWIEPYEGRWLAAARKRGWLPALFSRRKKRLLTNLIRCEAHRDVLLRALLDERPKND